MNKFSSTSTSKLLSCSKKLQDLFNQVIKTMDCTIIEGHRNQLRQEKLFTEGKSKAHWGQSKHNILLSQAVDVVPYLRGIDWRSDKALKQAIDRNLPIDDILFNIKRWMYFVGFVMGTATEMGIDIRWGGDWDMDTELSDNKFNDWPHFELNG